MNCRLCQNPDTAGGDLCDSCFDTFKTNVKFIPDYIMKHFECEGILIEAPKGSQTLACMKCGEVLYYRGPKE